MDKRLSASFRWELNQDVHLESAPRSAYSHYIPELVQLGCQKHAGAFPLPPHRHEREYEFVYVERGSVTWEVGGEFYPTNAGQWFFTYPGERHNARFNHMEPSTIWWLIVEAPAGDRDWLRLEPPERDLVLERFRRLPRVFRSANRSREQLARLKATLETEASTETALLARHHILDLIFGFFQQGTTKPIEPDLREAVVLSVERIARNPDRRISVGDMAQAVHLSESHYYKVFQEIFGQSPSAYLDRIRMERACEMLLSDSAITEIALELGYKTSQHFTTVFKKQIGSSPSAWRKTNVAGRNT